MIVDTSAIIAILKNEPDAERYAQALEENPAAAMSVASFVEASIIADSARSPILSRQFDQLIRAARIEVRPVSVEQGRIAREAYRDFGRGTGHPARLNFGDCFTYALAKESGEALLFKGSDFSETDIEAVP